MVVSQLYYPLRSYRETEKEGLRTPEILDPLQENNRLCKSGRLARTSSLDTVLMCRPQIIHKPDLFDKIEITIWTATATWVRNILANWPGQHSL